MTPTSSNDYQSLLLMFFAFHALLSFTDNKNNYDSGDDEDGEGSGGVNQAADFDRMMRSELIKVRRVLFLFVLFFVENVLLISEPVRFLHSYV